MEPVTTVVTLTKGPGLGPMDGGGGGGGTAWGSSGGLLPPLSTAKHGGAGAVRVVGGGFGGGVGCVGEGWLEGVMMLGVMGVAWLAVWL